MTIVLKTAHLLAQCSSIAYVENPDAATAALAAIGLDRPTFFNHADSHAFLAFWGGRLVLAHRGTDFDLNHVRDVLANLRVELEDHPLGGLVHRGYFHAVCEIWKDARVLIGNIDPGLLFVTGHSMGGVDATLAGSLAYEERMRPFVASFGAPKPGNQEFCDAISGMDLTRFVRESDFAPTYPFVGDVAQPGTEEWIHGGKVETVLTRPGLNELVPDHGIDRYVADLERLAA